MKRYFQLTFSVLAIALCLPAFGADVTITNLRPQTTDLQSQPALLAKIARALADQKVGGFTLVTNLTLAADTEAECNAEVKRLGLDTKVVDVQKVGA